MVGAWGPPGFTDSRGRFHQASSKSTPLRTRTQTPYAWSAACEWVGRMLAAFSVEGNGPGETTRVVDRTSKAVACPENTTRI